MVSTSTHVMDATLTQNTCMYICIYIPIHLPKYAFFVLFGKFLVISQCGIFYCFRSIFACSAFSYVFCSLGAALKPTLAYREVQRIPWPHWPMDAHRFCLQAIVVRHQILRRCWCFCQSHIKWEFDQISGPLQIERGRLWQSTLMGKTGICYSMSLG